MSDARDIDAAHDGVMIRTPDQHRRATPEEHRFLDALIFWRGMYAERGARDREPVQSLASAIAEAERRMRALRLGGRYVGS